MQQLQKQKELKGFNYEIKEFEINKDNIDSFKPLETMRAIRKTQVERIEKAITSKEYMNSIPIHVNLLKKEFRIIDGVHRLNAIRNSLESGKISSLVVNLAIYYDLNEQKEKELYDLIAKQVPQTAHDFISLHRTEFPLWNLIVKKSFPVKVTIYGSKDSVPFKTYLHLLASIKKKRFEPGTQAINRDKILVIGNNTDIESYNTLSRFMRIFTATFGFPGTINKFSRVQMIVPLFHIWYFNRKSNKVQIGEGESFTEDSKWVKLFERIMGDPEIILFANSVTSRESLPRVRSRMIELMQPRRDMKTTKHKLV